MALTLNVRLPSSSSATDITDGSAAMLMMTVSSATPSVGATDAVAGDTLTITDGVNSPLLTVTAAAGLLLLSATDITNGTVSATVPAPAALRPTLPMLLAMLVLLLTMLQPSIRAHLRLLPLLSTRMLTMTVSSATPSWLAMSTLRLPYPAMPLLATL